MVQRLCYGVSMVECNYCGSMTVNERADGAAVYTCSDECAGALDGLDDDGRARQRQSVRLLPPDGDSGWVIHIGPHA